MPAALWHPCVEQGMVFGSSNILSYFYENPWRPTYLLMMISNISLDVWSLRTKETIKLSPYLFMYHRLQHLTQSPFYLPKEYLLEKHVGFI